MKGFFDDLRSQVEIFLRRETQTSAILGHLGGYDACFNVCRKLKNILIGVKKKKKEQKLR